MLLEINELEVQGKVQIRLQHNAFLVAISLFVANLVMRPTISSNAGQ